MTAVRFGADVGTGAFDGVTGEFVEFNRVLRWSKKDGVEGTVKVRLYRKGNSNVRSISYTQPREFP